jgi:hypothetical protein
MKAKSGYSILPSMYFIFMIIVFFSIFGQVQCLLQEPAIRIWHEPAPIVTALALLALSCAKKTSVGASAQMFQN